MSIESQIYIQIHSYTIFSFTEIRKTNTEEEIVSLWITYKNICWSQWTIQKERILAHFGATVKKITTNPVIHHWNTNLSDKLLQNSDK